SGIFSTTAKKSRMPDFGRSTTWRAMWRFGSMRLRADRRFVGIAALAAEDEPLLLVSAQHEMRRGREHSANCGQPRRDEVRHGVQGRALHDDHEVVRAAHQ